MKKALVSIFLILPLIAFGQKAKESVNFFKPNYGWAIQVPFKGFSILSSNQFEEGCLKIEAYNETDKVILDFYFDKGAPYADSKKVRDYYENFLKQGGLKIFSVEKWEKGTYSYIIYKAKDVVVGTPPQDELNGSFYFSKGTTWIDVRFRIQNPQNEDIKKIKSYLEKVKFIESFEPTSEDNLFMGTLYCLSNYPDFCLSCYA
ncbi:MAG: hypothetical protein N2445_01485, partial [Acidobacteria bacterium]|nr:hypothetical protein [Acidobacteriota bacterium]